MLRQALEATKASTTNLSKQEIALREVMTYLSNAQWNRTTPELATNVHRIIKKVTVNVDPYSLLKEKYNRAALALYPRLVAIVEASEDPLLAAVKVAIAGNVIDFGPKVDINLEKAIEDVFSSDLAINDVAKLKKSLQRTQRVLYLADNAGETVFDKVLIDELLKQKVAVTYAVKGSPILNDATFKDAETAGITSIVPVISIGTDCTGILFLECSSDFIKQFEDAGLIISKGQGNYESLSGVENKEIFFLLKVKCPIIGEDIGVKVGSMILRSNFI